MRELISVAHFLWPIHIHHKLKMSGKVRFSRVLAVIGRHAADYLVRPRSRSQLEHWKPKNWALNTLSCDTLHVRRAGCSFKNDVTSARCEDRWVSATAEMNRMRAVPWQSVVIGSAAGRQVTYCPPNFKTCSYVQFLVSQAARGFK